MRTLPVLSVVIALAFPLLRAGADEPWTESLAGWSLEPHGDQPGQPHVANLRLDQAFKRFGAASLAFDFLAAPKSVYTELRLTLKQPYDARAFDVLHLSYHLPEGVQPSGFAVMMSAPDWSNGLSLREPLKPVAGEWQDLAIPLNAFAAGKPGWDWGKVGAVQVLFYWYNPAARPGTVHVDGLWLERTGEGIGQMKAPHSILFLDASVKDVDAKHRQALEQAGWVIGGENLGGLTWEKLSKFNVAVMGVHPGVDVNRPAEWEKTGGGKRALLERFVAEGGGLLVTGTPTSANAATGIGLLLKPMGMTLINEQVTDPAGVTLTQEMFPGMTFAYTDALTPDPLTEGVKGLWYCTSVQFTGGGGGAFTNPLQPGPEWKVLLKGSPSAGSHGFEGSFGLAKTGTFTASPPLCAVRELARGRVGVLPMNVTHLWLSGYHPWWQGLVLNGSAKDKPSQAERLLLNLYGWLAAPSLASGAVGGYLGEKPAAITGAKYVSAGDEGGVIDWARIVPTPASAHQYVGLVGAHSAYSDGEGTVAEWVAAAKSAGYQWLAFSEVLEKMTPEKWDKLKAECKAATNQEFCAIPGLKIVDPVGCHGLVLAPIPWPDPKLVAERMDLLKAIGYAYGMPVAVQYRLKEGIAPYYRDQFHHVGVYTYRDGKLIDDSEKEYWELEARNFQSWAVAVHETFRPGDVARERQTGYQTWYTFGPLDKMYDDFCFSHYQFFFHPDLTYVSSGPRIERFASQNNGTSYFDIPPEWPDSWRATTGADRWRAVLRAAADSGLQTVRLLDAGSPLREFRPSGEKQFFTTVDGHHDRQYVLGMEATDAKGGRAFCAASGTTAGRQWYGNCSDNVNVMFGGTYGSTDRAPGGYECYFPRWSAWSWPDLGVKDKQQLNLPHNERLRFSSTDCAIVDELFEMTHAPETPRVGGGRLAAPLFPLRDWTARVRTYFFTPGVDTPAFRLYESQVTLQRDLTFEGGRYPNVRLLDWDHGAPMAKGDFLYATVTMEDGRTLVEQTPEANDWPRVAYQGTLPLGGYAGAFPNYTGAGAVFALEPGLAFSVEGNAKSRRIGVGRQIPPGTVLKAGTVLTARMLTMEGAWRKLGRNTEIENTRQFLGLTGKPAYTITPTVGKVADTFYICTLQPENGAFRAKFSQAPLPVDLPVMVKGLNERWESGVWIVGHPRGVRFFGKWEGNGYTTLRLDKGPVDAFIGHPIVCDAEAVWLTLVEADEKHLLVSAHNPTDREIKTRVRKSQGFDLGPGLDKTVTIPAGTSVTVSTP